MSRSLVGLRVRTIMRHRQARTMISCAAPNQFSPSSSFHHLQFQPPLRLYSSTTSLFKDYPLHTLYPMPALSPTMESGTIASWNKSEGEAFIAGDVLCTIETDKASVDFEAQDEGVLAKILKQGNEAIDIACGTPICVVVDEQDDVPAFADFQVDDLQQSDPPKQESTSSVTPPSITTSDNKVSLLMPAARHLAESKGLDATGLDGTGKGGRVTKADVIQALESGALPPLQESIPSAKGTDTVPSYQTAAAVPAAASPPPVSSGPKIDLPLVEPDTTGSFEDVNNSKMRKIIASRLTESKRQVPHFYTATEVELDNVLALRKQLASSHEVKVSVNDFVIRCCALALRDVPEVNGTYNAKTEKVQFSDSIDVSVAVATPTGLITPIVFNTDKLGLSEITDTIRDLAGRARDGKLAPHEYQGGTFSVSNLGMFGIDEFSAVINPPQAAILAVGCGSRRIVPTPHVDGATEQPKPQIKTVMTARLSADRRVVDEATASLFMSTFKHYITKPELLLL